MCHTSGCVQMNLLHEGGTGAVFGEFELRRGRLAGEYEFVRARIAGKTYERAVSKRFAQWGYLVLPATEFAQALEGTHWKGLGYLRRSRVLAEGDGWLRWGVVVNEPESVGVARNGIQRVRMVRREYVVELFSCGVDVAPAGEAVKREPQAPGAGRRRPRR